MKWPTLRLVGVSIAAGVACAGCARDASAPAMLYRDGAVEDEPEVPADSADAGSAPPEPTPTPTPTVDAGGGANPPDDAGGEPPPSCSGSTPPSSVEVGGATFSAVAVNRGGNSASVKPGASVSVAFKYALSIDACAAVALPTVSPRIGFAEGTTACTATGTLCVAIIPGTSSASSTSLTLTAPSTPGEYGIYGALEHGTTFNGGDCGPYADKPSELTRIATVCVE